MDKYFVFDVESIGLHGEAFAVAYLVFEDLGDGTYSILEERCYSCPSSRARGDLDDHEWIQDNVPLGLIFVNAGDPRGLRDLFWAKLQKWDKEEGAGIWADHSWPVDVGLLHACIADNPAGRKFRGPNPVHDVSTLAAFILPAGERRPPFNEDELPAHDPRNDVRRSVRILQSCLNKLRESGLPNVDP